MTKIFFLLAFSSDWQCDWRHECCLTQQILRSILNFFLVSSAVACRDCAISSVIVEAIVCRDCTRQICGSFLSVLILNLKDVKMWTKISTREIDEIPAKSPMRPPIKPKNSETPKAFCLNVFWLRAFYLISIHLKLWERLRLHPFITLMFFSSFLTPPPPLSDFLYKEFLVLMFWSEFDQN